MKNLTSAIAGLALSLAAFSPDVHAVTINFNGLAGTNVPGSTEYNPSLDITVFDNGASLSTDGFQFANYISGRGLLVGQYYLYGDTGIHAYNASDYYVHDHTLVLSRAGGAAFQLSRLDAVGFTSGITGVRLEGTKSNGSIVTQTFEFSTIRNENIRIGNDFGRFNVAGFDDVVSIRFDSTGYSGGIAYDNFVIDEPAQQVPEPASLALLALGLAAWASIRTRCHAARLRA